MLARLALGVTTTTTVVSGLAAYQLRRRLHTDPLTGLGNRAALESAFERARRRRTAGMLAVAIGDLNGFKALNDTHGHRFGDRVLVEVATVLTRQWSTTGARPFRLHGDEFALLLPSVVDQREAEDRISGVQEAVASLTEVDGQPVEVSMALGVITTPVRRPDLSALLAIADDRMYGDKHATTPTHLVHRTVSVH